MNYRFIKSPSKATIDILNRRKGSKENIDFKNIDAVGLVQGKLIDIIYASDIAEKSAGVIVEEIKGSCPQNIIVIAIFGDTSSVEVALENIKRSEKGDF
ncbi:MAG: BMC domain-containing protein [Miniphocaeibacter sp.]|jgi:hypothetical protein|uniref:BMC domain-containing protein n=1 Tax=Miniphocaeibacter sp. TaxID=3100973 RepID=UPI0017B8A377|nr:BMC domain-containing protein [Gallicola sp.]